MAATCSIILSEWRPVSPTSSELRRMSDMFEMRTSA